MKQMLTAAAIAAAVLAGVPAWAQAPTSPYASGMPSDSGPITHVQPSLGASSQTPPAEPSATSAGASTEEAAPEPSRKRHAARRHRERHAAAHTTAARRSSKPNDNMANQLNRQEAERVQSGNPSAPPAGGMPPGSSMAAPPPAR